MTEVILQLKKPETIKILKGLAKYLDFKIVGAPKKDSQFDDILIPGDSTIDISDMKDVFSGKNIDAKELRESLWQRKK